MQVVCESARTRPLSLCEDGVCDYGVALLLRSARAVLERTAVIVVECLRWARRR
jgi:hypothetical protein